MTEAEKIIKLLNLVPLEPEGGFFRETYRCSETLDPSVFEGNYHTRKSLSTAIYYLLTGDTFSSMHRLPSDEIYHFYLGDPVNMLLLYPAGESKVIKLGNDIAGGSIPQFVVPAGVWQGSFVMEGGGFALMGATVSPGYDDTDLEIGDRKDLSKQFPDVSNLIHQLTRI